MDTILPGRASGYLSPIAQTILITQLSATSSSAGIALVMHHHPFTTQTPLIDKYILKNTADLLYAITASQRKVALIICGHVHGDYDLTAHGIRLISSPATCLRWQKGTQKMAINDVGGFTLWTFSTNGEFHYQTHYL